MTPAGIFLLAASAALAQSQPAFEVASVKPAEPLVPGRRPAPLAGGPGTKTPNRLAGTASMKAILMWAYGIKTFQLTGPSWMDTERYEIVAKVPQGATKEQVALMLQSLLAERFHLSVHRETKELPTYVLLPGKNGPKLEKSDPAAAEDDDAFPDPGMPRPRVTMGKDGFPEIPPGAKVPGSFTLTLSGGEFTRTKVFARHRTMDQLAETIGIYVNRLTRNLTELPGRYDFTLAFESAPDVDIAAARPAEARDDSGPTIFAAVQQQLGLRLEPRKGPVEMLIVDRLDKVPTGN
jgi:uncharacterized protein (TIGR03435 family)